MPSSPRQLPKRRRPGVWQTSDQRPQQIPVQPLHTQVAPNVHDESAGEPQGRSSQTESTKRQRLNETRSSSNSDSNHSASQVIRPTYRSDLAAKGLLVNGDLGCGSYSKVKLVIDTFSNPARVLAAKIVDRLKAPTDYVNHFLPRELRIWSRLNHPNLVQLFDVFEENDRVYMMLEYVDGGDVLTHIQTKGAVAESLAKSWLTQMSAAIRYMHDRNVSHRDLKLENLLLTNQCQTVKLCDFGFVKEALSTEDLSQTFCGSKAYAAPEILQGKPYDPKKGDIWAIGVITYILVTGKMPFDETRGTKRILEDQMALKLHWSKTSRVSSLCHHLVLRMLTWRFADRITIAQVQADPWLTGEAQGQIQSSLNRVGASSQPPQ